MYYTMNEPHMYTDAHEFLNPPRKNNSNSFEKQSATTGYSILLCICDLWCKTSSSKRKSTTFPTCDITPRCLDDETLRALGLLRLIHCNVKKFSAMKLHECCNITWWLLHVSTLCKTCTNIKAIIEITTEVVAHIPRPSLRHLLSKAIFPWV